MERNILVISDSITPREEALRYSAGLAERLESLTVLLVLLESYDSRSEARMGGEGKEMEKLATRALAGYLGGLDLREMRLEPWVRIGDPASEAIKFLAGTGSYKAVVWAGREGAASLKHAGFGPHWLLRVADQLDCPLLVPSRK